MINSEEASRIIAANFSVKTYEKVIKHLARTGEKDATIERAKGIMENYIGALLETNCNFDYSRSEEDFMEDVKALVPLLGTLEEKDRADKIDQLKNLCSDGYFYGYIAAAKDIERIMNDLDGPTEEETKDA